MDNGSQVVLTIQRLPQGGYIVQDAFRGGDLTCQHFACTTIDEALKFLRDKLSPIRPQQGSVPY